MTKDYFLAIENENWFLVTNERAWRSKKHYFENFEIKRFSDGYIIGGNGLYKLVDLLRTIKDARFYCHELSVNDGPLLVEVMNSMGMNDVYWRDQNENVDLYDDEFSAPYLAKGFYVIRIGKTRIIDSSKMFNFSYEKIASILRLKYENVIDKAMLIFHLYSYLIQKMTKLTPASQSYNDWILQLGESIVGDKVQTRKGGYEWRLNAYDKWTSEYLCKQKLIEKILPVDWLKESFNGYDSNYNNLSWYKQTPITFVNERYENKKLQGLLYGDYINAYGSILASDMICPYGKPCSIKEGDIFFGLLRVNRDIKLLKGYYPFFGKELFPEETYYIDSEMLKRIIKIYALIEGDYTFEIEYSFKGTKFSNLFGEYIKPLYEKKKKAKKDGNIVLEKYNKNLINYLIGKFAKKSGITIGHFKNGKYYYTFEQGENSAYYPIYLMVVSLQNCRMLDLIGNKYDNVIAAHTDSIIAFSNFFDDVDCGHNLGDLELDSIGECKGVVKSIGKYILENSLGERRFALMGVQSDRFDISAQEQSDSEYTKIGESLTFDELIEGKNIKQLRKYRAPNKLLFDKEILVSI